MIRFDGEDYQRVAVKVEGFEDTSTGTIPRASLTFSNSWFCITDILGLQ